MWHHQLDLGPLGPLLFIYLMFSGRSSRGNCSGGGRSGGSGSIHYHCVISLDMIICYYRFRQNLHAWIVI